jgi:uncharacterized iron-regulated membrane protein
VMPMGLGSGEPERAYTRIAPPLDADRAMQVAVSGIPDVRPLSVQVPLDQGDPYVVQMEHTGSGVTVPPVMALVDAATGEISYVDDPRSYAFGNRVLNLQHAIHFGIGLGWLWTVLVFVSGLLPLLLAVTGVTIWWKKRRARTA